MTSPLAAAAEELHGLEVWLAADVMLMHPVQARARQVVAVARAELEAAGDGDQARLASRQLRALATAYDLLDDLGLPAHELADAEDRLDRACEHLVRAGAIPTR